MQRDKETWIKNDTTQRKAKFDILSGKKPGLKNNSAHMKARSEIISDNVRGT